MLLVRETGDGLYKVEYRYNVNQISTCMVAACAFFFIRPTLGPQVAVTLGAFGRFKATQAKLAEK